MYLNGLGLTQQETSVVGGLLQSWFPSYSQQIGNLVPALTTQPTIPVYQYGPTMQPQQQTQQPKSGIDFGQVALYGGIALGVAGLGYAVWRMKNRKARGR